MLFHFEVLLLDLHDEPYYINWEIYVAEKTSSTISEYWVKAENAIKSKATSSKIIRLIRKEVAQVK